MPRPALRKMALAACFLAFAVVGLATGARDRVAAALARGDLDAARAIQDRLAVLRLDDPEQRFALAHGLLAADRLDEAAAQFVRALARSPQAESWAALAAVHVQRDDPEAAIAAWERGFETNGDPSYLHRASELLLQRGETERAFAQVERALSIEPPSALIHARIADLAQGMGLPEHEIRHLRAALAFEPGRHNLRGRLAWRLATCDPPALLDGEDAVQLAAALVDETGRRDASLLDTLAAALAAAERFDAAVLVAAEADDLASRRADHELAAAIRERLALYRSGRRYVEAPPRVKS